MSTQNSNYFLLPADATFLSHLEETHNIRLEPEDLQTLTLFYNQTSDIWERRLANEPNAVYYDIDNGKVLAVVAFAVVGFFLAPVLGLGALTGALIGASIGWRLFGGAQKKVEKQQNSKEEKATAQTFGFNSAPAIAPIGGIIPLVFTNKQINTSGGVRTSGVVLHSRVDTFGGVQRLYAVYGLCLGEIGKTDELSLLINNQPRNTFFQEELITYTQNGTINQSVLDRFPVYAQCITVSTNNQIGVSKRGKNIGNTTFNTSQIFIEPDSFDSFNPTDRYVINGQEFTIVSKNKDSNSLITSRPLNINLNDEIFSIYNCKYQTSKSCTEINLNLVANLWGRDENNTLQQHGLLFGVNVDGYHLGRFLISNKNESDIMRRLIIRNLPYNKHNIEIFPVNGTNSTDKLYVITDNQQITTINTIHIINNNNIQIEFENSPSSTITVSEVNNIVNLNKKQTSSDRGAICQLSTVNEIVYAQDLGHPYFTNYRNIALGGLVALASNRLQSDPSPSWEITQGIKGRIYYSAGYANSSSSDNQLNDISATFVNDGVLAGLMIRNLDQGIESVILNYNQNLIITQTPLFWRQGDRYVIFQDNQPLCYFPDIYVWTLTQRLGGLGGLLRGTQLSDYFIDYPSIVRSRKFCVANNYFWDGAIESSVSWSQWASQESMGSLLFPTRIGGKFGLIPETQTTPVALFNASNILPDSYAEDYAPKQKLNCVHVTYTDNSNGTPRDRTASVMTTPARNGSEALFPESLKFAAVTNKNQAIRIGQIYLKSRLLQDRVIQFGTGLQGYGLREGDLIIVQHLTTEIDKECSGFVLDAGSFINGTQKLVLSSPSPIGLDGNYSAAVYRLETSSFQQNLTCVGLREGNPSQNYLQISGLTSPLLPPRENYTGDYVIVGKDTTHRRTYRVQKIEPQDNGSVNITAVLWVPEILGSDGLVTID